MEIFFTVRIQLPDLTTEKNVNGDDVIKVINWDSIEIVDAVADMDYEFLLDNQTLETEIIDITLSNHPFDLIWHK